MNKTLDNYLCEAYPRIFIERSKSPRESCMGRGFECGNGWFPIINSLCYNIQQHIDGHNKYAKDRKEKPIPQFVAEQVKEKFGALRIYYQGGDEYCKGLVDMAATWSWNTCEICGDGGKRLVGHTTGWIGSICGECSKKIKRKIGYDKEIKAMLVKAVKQDIKRYV
jgi:hypothetical protein